MRAERPRREQLEPAAVLGRAFDVRHPHRELVEAPHRVRRRAHAAVGGSAPPASAFASSMTSASWRAWIAATISGAVARGASTGGPAARRDAAAALDKRGRPLAALAGYALWASLCARRCSCLTSSLWKASSPWRTTKGSAPERQPRRVVAAVDLHRQAAVEAARRVHDRTVELRRRGGGAENAGAVAGAEEEVREAVVVLPEEVEGGGDERAAARAADAAAAAAAAAERRRQQRGGVGVGAPEQPANSHAA